MARGAPCNWNVVGGCVLRNGPFDLFVIQDRKGLYISESESMLQYGPFPILLIRVAILARVRIIARSGFAVVAVAA